MSNEQTVASAARPPGNAGFTLRIERNIQGLARLGGWVDEIVTALALTEPVEYALRFCVEEAATNIVIHGRPVPGTDAGTVTLTVAQTPCLLRLVITDRCAWFDPCLAPAQNVAADPDRIGGLGIPLMRRYAKDIRYRRDGDANRLTLTIARAD
jgi:anti-sigma regulatory factor (Ser/Thr protein kinase)